MKNTGDVHWNAFGGLVPSKEKQNVLGVLMPSACFQGRSPKEGANYACFIGGARHPEYINKTDKELIGLVNTSLHTMLDYPKGTCVSIVRIYRHNHAVPQYVPETDARLRTIDTVELTYPGLYIIGNLKDSIGMSDRTEQAVDMAERISLSVS